jgi:tyrosyl-tRNA synthetase
MDINERLGLIQQVGEEILTHEELKTLLETKKKPVAYDGFEPSGQLHIAQGLLRAINIGRMVDAGCHFKMWVADWFAWMNNKYDGDLEKIHKAGEYFIETWKACGLDTSKVEFVWTSEEIGNKEYWTKVIQIGRNSTLQRVLRTTQIMGRSEKDTLSAAQIFYPCMQAADIFHLKADICQLGMDQRKVNILAREVGPKLFGWKPVAVHHHMLMGLQAPPAPVGEGDGVERAIAMKMSKSNPNSAIFMQDTPEDVVRKIKNAYCPEKQTTENPILEYNKYIVFNKLKALHIERPAKFGGPLDIASYAELEELFAAGKLHPMDLKSGTAAAINELLEPVRKHFSKGKPAELLEQVRSFQITR